VAGKGRLYLIDPLAEGNILDLRSEFLEQGGLDHDFYKCLWYWYEVEARVERFRKQYPSVPVCRINTEELGDLERIRSMFDCLRIEYDSDKLNASVGVRSNLKGHRKTIEKEAFSPSDLHRRFLGVLESKYESRIWGALPSRS
jgi:hypothetical protein